MASKMFIKKGSDRPWYSTLKSDVDTDLTDVTGVVVYMRKAGAEVNVVDGEAAVIEAQTTTSISVRYDPASGDVDDPGTFNLYWLATFTSGRTGRFPSEGFDQVLIGANFE